MKTSVAIVGCGTVGTALATLLGKAGYSIVGISTRNPQRASEIAQSVGARQSSAAPWEFTRNAQWVFITTPDDVIKETCDLLTSKDAFCPRTVVIHCSGAHPSTILESARQCEAAILSVHPLQSFASAKQAIQLVPGSYFAMEGDPAAMPAARRLVTDLKGIGLEIKPGLKSLYHAAAVTASNYLVSLIDMSLEFDRLAGISPQTAFQALTPLIRGTLKNVEAQGIPEALTGPIARGDISTVSGHLTAIREHLPEFLPMFVSLGAHTVQLALDKGTISDEIAHKLQHILRSR
jgi:predicted short-subunit dehydrogenase-like oxidoreductase (DUF2520 family)